MSMKLSFRDYYATVGDIISRDIIPLDTEYRHDRVHPAYLAFRSQQDLMGAARVIGGEDLAERVQDQWPQEWKTVLHGGWMLCWREAAQR